MEETPPVRGRTLTFSSLIVLLFILALCALFAAVLLPSLHRARTGARRVRTQALLFAAGKGLEMFANDFRMYPDSSLRRDPIHDDGGGKADGLSGAHWLARALSGHDGRGVDRGGVLLGDGSSSGLTKGAADELERKGTYIEAGVWARDSELQRGGDYQATGRFVMIDSERRPVLYYRLSGATQLPQSETDTSAAVSHRDNALITGASDRVGWDFAGSGRKPAHCIGRFSTGDAADVSHACDSFQARLQHALPTSVSNAGSVVPASGPQTASPGFLLIAAGADGIYGTHDDVTHSQRTP